MPVNMQNPYAEGGMFYKPKPTQQIQLTPEQFEEYKKQNARPEIGAYKSPLDKKGNLASQYQVRMAGVTPTSDMLLDSSKYNLDTSKYQLDNSAMNALKARGLSSGDSPWLKMALEKQGLEQSAAMDMAARNQAGAQAGAFSQLAMRGGIGSGARERLARGGASDLARAKQEAARAGMMDRLNLGMYDDQTKLDIQKALPGMDIAAKTYSSGLDKYNIENRLGVDKANAGTQLDIGKFNAGQKFDANKMNAMNALGGLSGENQYNMYNYGEKMKGYAADKTGKAIGAGGSPGLLPTIFGTGG